MEKGKKPRGKMRQHSHGIQDMANGSTTMWLHKPKRESTLEHEELQRHDDGNATRGFITDERHEDI
jgi:hypothetical protein